MAQDNKIKLYEALKSEGYDNFKNQSDFDSYIHVPANRKKLFDALKQEGFDNFSDEKSFDDYLGYADSEGSDMRKYLEESGQLERLDEAGRRAQGVIDKNGGEFSLKQGLFGGILSLPSAVKYAYNRLFNPEARAAYATKEKVEEAKALMEEAGHADKGWADKQLGGLARGFAKGLTDEGTWDFGVTGTADAYTLNDILSRQQKGEKITPSEQDLLDVSGLSAAVEDAYRDQVGMGYNVGRSLPESAGFMAQMYLNPASGLAKAAVKKYGTTTVKKVMARAAGDVAEMGIGTLTTGLGRVAEDAINRTNGQSTYDVDENGIIRYGGQADQENAVNATFKALGSNFIENYSEAMGEYFSPMGNFLGNMTKKGLRKGGLGKLVDTFDWMKSSQWSRAIQDFKDKTKFNGLVGEYMEEVAGNIMNASTVGDMNFNSPDDPRSVFNLETNIETALSCAFMSGTMMAVERFGDFGESHRLSRKVVNAEREAEKAFAGGVANPAMEWSKLREGMEKATPDGLSEMMTTIKEDADLTPEQKGAAINYGLKLLTWQAYNSRKMANKEEMTGEALAAEEAYNEGMAMPPEQHYSAEQEKTMAGEALRNADAGLFETVEGLLEDDSSFGEMENLASGLSDEQSSLVWDYYNKAKRVDGILDAALEEAIDAGDNAANALNDAIVEDENGNRTITTALYKDGTVYVLADDGKHATILRDGKKEMVASERLENLQRSDADEFIRKMKNTILEDKQKALNNSLNHHSKTQEPQAGMQLWNGDVPFIVTDVSADGVVQAFPSERDDKTGQMVPKKDGLVNMTVEEAKNLQDDYYKKMAAAEKPEAEGQPFAEPQRKKVLSDGRVAVQTGADEREASFDVLDRGGNVVDSGAMPIAEFETLKDYIPEDESVDNTSENQAENASSPETGESKLSETDLGDANLIPVDEKGNVLYYQVPVEVTVADLTDGTLDNAEIDGFVSANQVEANKLLDKVKKSAPKIGTNKAKYLEDKKAWQAKVDEARQQSDYWKEVSAFIKQQREQPGDKVAEEIMAMGESLDGLELAAQRLAGGNLPLLYEDYKRELGFGDKEAGKMFGLFKSRENGGLTIEEAGELLMQDDLEAGTNFFDPSDANAGRNAILDVLSSARTRGDLTEFIRKNRDAMAERERSAEEEHEEMQREAWAQENFGMSYADYVTFNEVIDDIIREKAIPEEIREFYNTFAEELNNWNNGRVKEETEGNDRGPDSEGGESGEGVLPDKQLGDTGGVEADTPTETDVNADNEGVPAPEENIEARIEEARKEVAPNPTDAQKEAGNYKKGHVKIDGYDITIENPKGSERSGTDANGDKWSVTMNNDYGYIRGTEGVDGDHIDVFLSDNPAEGNVYVVDQLDTTTGKFDEHKVMYGFGSIQEATDAYLANYSPGWMGIGAVTEVSKDEFKKWIESSRRKTKPFAEYKSIKTVNSLEENDTNALDVARDRLANLEQEWRDRILDYIAEHYPTQATVSAQTNSPKGIREKAAMKEDEILKRMRSQARDEINAADEKVMALSKSENAEDDTRFRIVHHGTGTSFDKFSTEKIGTGEGNQSFGWGLYFTDKKDIAQYYAETIGDMPSYVLYKDGKPADMNDEISRVIYNYDGDVKKAIRSIKRNANMWKKEGDEEFAAEIMKTADRLKLEDPNSWEMKEEGNRHIYDVEIPDTGFLHWDNPMTDEQKRLIIEQAGKEGIKISFYGDLLPAAEFFEKMGSKAEGAQIYKAIERTLGSDKEASLFLNRAGFNGIEYVAGRHSGKKSVDSNFVIFDENAVKIINHLQYREQESISDDGKLSIEDAVSIVRKFKKSVPGSPEIAIITNEEDIDNLRVGDITKGSLKRALNNPRVTGCYSNRTKMVFVFPSHTSGASDFEDTLAHETAHYASRKVELPEKLKESVLEYVKEKYPEVYSNVEEYPEGHRAEEAVAYLFEKKCKEFGIDIVLKSKFAGDKDVVVVFTEITNFLNHGKGREHNPLGEKEGERREPEGRESPGESERSVYDAREMRRDDVFREGDPEGYGGIETRERGTQEAGNAGSDNVRETAEGTDADGRRSVAPPAFDPATDDIIEFAERVVAFNRNNSQPDKPDEDAIRYRISEEDADKTIAALNSRIASLEKKISKLEDREELRRSVTDFIRREVGSELMGYLDKQDLNSLLIQAQNAKSTKSLEKIVMNVKNVMLNAQRRRLQRITDRLLSLKVQDVNGKNMSIAKNVDDSTRKVFSFLRGKVSNLALSGFEDEMKYLRREIKDKQTETARLNNILGTAKEEEEKRRLSEQLSSLSVEIAELKGKLDAVKKEADTVKEQVLNQGDIDVDAEMKRLDEKLGNAAAGKDIWTQGDTERMAALNILGAIQTNKKHDYEIEAIEIDKQKLLLNNSDLFRERIGKNETERKRITEQINENYRRIVAYDRLVNDIRAMQVKQMGITVEQLNELIGNGKNSLMRKTEEEIKRKRELVGKAIRSVEGKPIDIFKENQNTENWAKKFFSAPLGSFEYMCRRVNTKTLGKDGFLYKRFIEGSEGTLKAYDTYVEGMKEFRNRLDEKCKEVFGKKFEKIASFSDKPIEQSGVYIVQSGNGQAEGYGVRYELPLTKGQAMYIYQVWKMNDGRTKLELQGFDEESIKQIVDFLGDEYVRFADWVQDELLREMREKYNAKYLEMYNTSLADIENYIPLKIRKEAIRQDSSLSEDGKKRKTLEEKAGSLINRTANTKPVDITCSGFDVLLEHGNQMEEWNAYSRVRKDLDYILSSTVFRNQLNANARGSYENFYDAAEVATKSNHPDSAKYGDMVLGKLSKGIVGGNIAFRINTALKQVLSAPAFLGYSQSPAYMGHLVKSMVTPYANFKWCMENIPSFYERVNSGTIGNEKLDEKGFSKLMDKYIEFGMIPNKMVDAITCSIGAKSIYDYKFGQLKKAGIPEEEARRQALREADIYYNATQQSSHPAFLSPMQMSRTLTDRMLTTYQNSNIGYVRRVMGAFYDLTRSLKWKEMKADYVKMYMEEGMTEQEAESKAYRRMLNENRKNVVELALFGWGLNLLWNIGSQGLLGFFRGEGDDDDDKWTKDLVFTLTSPMKGLPGGNLLESIASGYGMNPFLVYEELDKFMKELDKTVDEYGIVSPEMAYITLAKASRYSGVDLEVWGNIYLGIEGMTRAGLSDDKMIDIMYMLNSPKSSREQVAKELYKDEPFLEYAEKITRAMKYIPKKKESEIWVPGAKPLTKRKENEIKKEAKILQMSPEEREKHENKELLKKHKRKMKELKDDPEDLRRYKERHKEELDKLTEELNF